MARMDVGHPFLESYLETKETWMKTSHMYNVYADAY